MPTLRVVDAFGINHESDELPKETEDEASRDAVDAEIAAVTGLPG